MSAPTARRSTPGEIAALETVGEEETLVRIRTKDEPCPGVETAAAGEDVDERTGPAVETKDAVVALADNVEVAVGTELEADGPVEPSFLDRLLKQRP